MKKQLIMMSMLTALTTQAAKSEDPNVEENKSGIIKSQKSKSMQNNDLNEFQSSNRLESDNYFESINDEGLSQDESNKVSNKSYEIETTKKR